MTPKILRYPDLEAIYKISKTRAKLLVAEGVLHPRKMGNNTVFLVDDVENYVNGLPLAK